MVVQIDGGGLLLMRLHDEDKSACQHECMCVCGRAHMNRTPWTKQHFMKVRLVSELIGQKASE